MTTRQFKLYGIQTISGSTGTITIDGNTVLSGSFGGNTDPLTSVLTSGSLTFSDAEETVHPVEITVTSGEIQVGLIEWNYGRLKNRNLTDPEFQKLLDYEALVSDILSTVQSKAVPAFTAEELAKFDPTDITLLQKLISSTKEQSDELQSIFSTHGIAPFQRYDDVFSLIDLPLATWEALIDLQSGTPDAQQQEAILSAFSSRAQPLLDNVEPTDAFTNKFITVTAGAVLTFNATAFANNAVIL